jgi:RNA polymerase sigma-70 factor, ECF subfamily
MLDVVTAGERARFWDRLGPRRRAELGALGGWEARLDAALGAPAGAFGDRDWLTREEFAAELGVRLDADAHDVLGWWDHLHAADLYLASACSRGVPAAIARFEGIYGAEIARSAERFQRPGLPAEDLLQLLRKKLFLAELGDVVAPAAPAAEGEPEPRPRIASYTGQGFLQNWVRVTATRTFIDSIRVKGDTQETPLADQLAAMLPEPGADPELQLLKREHARAFKAAFADAVAALDGSERLVLRQHFCERLTIDQIGALYHLHRATAARRLSRARQALLAATRAALARRLGVSALEIEGVLELIASRMDASVERLLRGDP